MGLVAVKQKLLEEISNREMVGANGDALIADSIRPRKMPFILPGAEHSRHDR
jgi:hypothetical protein